RPFLPCSVSVLVGFVVIIYSFRGRSPCVPASNGDWSPRQRTVAVASPGSMEGTSSEILLFGYPFERGGSCRGFAKDLLRKPAHEVQDHRVADRRAAGGRQQGWPPGSHRSGVR